MIELNVSRGEARVFRTDWSWVMWADGLGSNPLATLTTAYFNHSFYLWNSL